MYKLTILREIDNYQTIQSIGVIKVIEYRNHKLGKYKLDIQKMIEVANPTQLYRHGSIRGVFYW